MFETGELVIYDDTGVCRVEEIGLPEGIPVSDKNRKYYTLVPVFHGGKIYIPVDTKAFIRRIISHGEAEALVEKIPEIREESVEPVNQKLLEEKYRLAVKSHECEELVRLIKTVYWKKKDLTRRKKKAGRLDTEYMSRAKRLLYEELAAALEIPVEKVEDYITARAEENGYREE